MLMPMHWGRFSVRTTEQGTSYVGKDNKMYTEAPSCILLYPTIPSGEKKMDAGCWWMIISTGAMVLCKSVQLCQFKHIKHLSYTSYHSLDIYTSTDELCKTGTAACRICQHLINATVLVRGGGVIGKCGGSADSVVWSAGGNYMYLRNDRGCCVFLSFHHCREYIAPLWLCNSDPCPLYIKTNNAHRHFPVDAVRSDHRWYRGDFLTNQQYFCILNHRGDRKRFIYCHFFLFFCSWE